MMRFVQLTVLLREFNFTYEFIESILKPKMAKNNVAWKPVYLRSKTILAQKKEAEKFGLKFTVDYSN